jgi:putative peptidoglycan lipid II flippase
MRSSLSATLRGILLLSIPASLGLVLLRKPIITFLLQRGEFTAYSTKLVAWALLWYGIGLVGHAMVEILARAFYALHDTKTPVLIGIAAMSINVILSFIFSALFQRWGLMPHGGLALANTVATSLEMIGLILIMRVRIQGLNGIQIWKSVIKAAGAGLLMAGAIQGWIALTDQNSAWVIAVGGVSIGMIVYIAALGLFKTPEVRQLYQGLRNRSA